MSRVLWQLTASDTSHADLYRQLVYDRLVGVVVSLSLAEFLIKFKDSLNNSCTEGLCGGVGWFVGLCLDLLWVIRRVKALALFGNLLTTIDYSIGQTNNQGVF